jgi:hypothetical protein
VAFCHQVARDASQNAFDRDWTNAQETRGADELPL